MLIAIIYLFFMQHLHHTSACNKRNIKVENISKSDLITVSGNSHYQRCEGCIQIPTKSLHSQQHQSLNDVASWGSIQYLMFWQPSKQWVSPQSGFKKQPGGFHKCHDLVYWQISLSLFIKISRWQQQSFIIRHHQPVAYCGYVGLICSL